MLYGPPGTGKTLLARAVAHHVRDSFVKNSSQVPFAKKRSFCLCRPSAVSSASPARNSFRNTSARCVIMAWALDGGSSYQLSSLIYDCRARAWCESFSSWPGQLLLLTSRFRARLRDAIFECAAAADTRFVIESMRRPSFSWTKSIAS